MSQPPSRASYLFDRTAEDQRRLIQSSEVLNEFTIEACLRAGLGPGGRAIDVGCGPGGALPILARIVGREGQVAGFDNSAEALALARTILDERDCSNVTLVQGDLGTIKPADLCPPGPFDLAYIRRFLVHQPDPGACLGHVVRLMRRGGRIVAHEIPPATGYPALTPPVRAIQRVDELVHAGVKARGGKHDAAHHFTTFCREAGVRLLSQRGFLPAAGPVALLDTFQAVWRSLRSVVLAQGITTADEVGDLLGQLEEAKAAKYISSFANLYIEMIAEVL